jgi:hypothetical protein
MIAMMVIYNIWFIFTLIVFEYLKDDLIFSEYIYIFIWFGFFFFNINHVSIWFWYNNIYIIIFVNEYKKYIYVIILIKLKKLKIYIILYISKFVNYLFMCPVEEDYNSYTCVNVCTVCRNHYKKWLPWKKTTLAINVRYNY